MKKIILTTALLSLFVTAFANIPCDDKGKCTKDGKCVKGEAKCSKGEKKACCKKDAEKKDAVCCKKKEGAATNNHVNATPAKVEAKK